MRKVVGPLAVLMLALVVPSPVRASADVVSLGSLATDGTVFWDQGWVGASPVHALPGVTSPAQVDRCELDATDCRWFTLDVTGSGEALRIAYDTPSRDDGFEIRVVDPNGVQTVRAPFNVYSAELLFPSPATGTWSIRMAPFSAEDAPYRLRAKLESVHFRPTADVDGYLLPNLRVTRMWEFGFVAPANPLNGLFPPDDVNPPLEVAGVAPLSCAVDEMVEDGVSRCLRYSFGLANVGDGNFDVRWTSDGTGAPAPMSQCLQRGAGEAPVARAAGTGSLHLTHGHWHYEDIIYHELLRVDSPGVLTPAGDGKKIGYSPADQGIAEWDVFTQAVSGSSGGAGNCVPGSTSRLGMAPGWGDAYRYQRPGNYVEFGPNDDAEYVVRTIADPLDNVLESDETDNVSYAHVRVTGDEVEVLETGLGSDPWDPGKVVVEDWWAA